MRKRPSSSSSSSSSQRWKPEEIEVLTNLTRGGRGKAPWKVFVPQFEGRSVGACVSAATRIRHKSHILKNQERAKLETGLRWSEEEVEKLVYGMHESAQQEMEALYLKIEGKMPNARDTYHKMFHFVSRYVETKTPEACRRKWVLLQKEEIKRQERKDLGLPPAKRVMHRKGWTPEDDHKLWLEFQKHGKEWSKYDVSGRTGESIRKRHRILVELDQKKRDEEEAEAWRVALAKEAERNASKSS